MFNIFKSCFSWKVVYYYAFGPRSRERLIAQKEDNSTSLHNVTSFSWFVQVKHTSCIHCK